MEIRILKTLMMWAGLVVVSLGLISPAVAGSENEISASLRVAIPESASAALQEGPTAPSPLGQSVDDAELDSELRSFLAELVADQSSVAMSAQGGGCSAVTDCPPIPGGYSRTWISCSGPGPYCFGDESGGQPGLCFVSCGEGQVQFCPGYFGSLLC